jgi:hypothetical protein
LVQLQLELLWAVLQHVDDCVERILVKFYWNLVLEYVKQGFQISSFFQYFLSIFLFQEKQTVDNRKHLGKVLQMLCIYQIVLVLNSKVSSIWDRLEIPEGAKVPLGAIERINDDAMFFVPMVISLAQNGLQTLQKRGDGYRT